MTGPVSRWVDATVEVRVYLPDEGVDGEDAAGWANDIIMYAIDPDEKYKDSLSVQGIEVFPEVHSAPVPGGEEEGD